MSKGVDYKPAMKRRDESWTSDTDAKRKDTRRLLGLPVELKTQIFSHLMEDLHVEAIRGSWDDSSDTACVIAPGHQPWKALLDLKAVSKEFQSLVDEAFNWACKRQHIRLICDTRNATLREVPKRGQRNFTARSFGDPNLQDFQHQIPAAIHRAFSCLKVIVPVQVSSAHRLPVVSKTRAFNVIFTLSARHDMLSTTQTRWSNVNSCQDFGQSLMFAMVFDAIHARLIDEMLWVVGDQSDPQSHHEFSADAMLSVIIFLGHGVKSSNPPAFLNSPYRVFKIEDAIRACAAERDRHVSAAIDDSIVPSRSRLAYYNNRPGGVVWNANTNQGGVSFLTKWKHIAALINSRRWEESPLVKLGWRGSPPHANADLPLLDTDGDCVVNVLKWLSSLGPCDRKHVEAHGCLRERADGSDSSPGVMARTQSLVPERRHDAVTKMTDTMGQLAMDCVPPKPLYRTRTKFDTADDLAFDADYTQTGDIADSLVDLSFYARPKLGWHGSRDKAVANQAAYSTAKEKDEEGVAKALNWINSLAIPHDLRTISQSFSSLPFKNSLGSKLSLVMLGDHISMLFPCKGYGHGSIAERWWDYAADHL